jgi:fission process protein 1
MANATVAEAEGYNVFRDSPLRYMGYANEVGESFRYQVPKLVMPSYGLAFGYCVLDAATTGYDTWCSHKPATRTSFTITQARSREMATAVTTVDTLLWQALASVMVPGATINTIVKACRFAVSRTTVLPVALAAWVPTGVGLVSIPIIIKPIDNAVDYLLDNTTRQWMAEEGET